MKAQTQYELPFCNKWALWVSPDARDMNHLKRLDQQTLSRVLVFHPRNTQNLANALVSAIESGNYESFTLRKGSIGHSDYWRVSTLAKKSGVILIWR